MSDVKLEKIPPRQMAYMAANFLVDPYTCAEYLKSVGIKKGLIFLEENKKLVREREERRNAFIMKQASKSWLEKFLGL